MPFTVAIDGPAASGKGTLARRIAERYGFHHLDTGLTYRAVAWAVLESQASLADKAQAARVARTLDLQDLDRAVLSRHEIGEAASSVALMPTVRTALVEAQRRFAAREPGAVMDGRDIGTVVCPDADLKLYVTASPEVRARRRHAEILQDGAASSFDAVLADLQRRDARDMGRADSPLKPAGDVHLLDTTKMDIEAPFRAAVQLVEAAMKDRND